MSREDQTELVTPLLASDEEEPLFHDEPTNQHDHEEGDHSHQTTENKNTSAGVTPVGAELVNDAEAPVLTPVESPESVGEVQDAKWQDIFFAILFYILFFAIAIHGSVQISHYNVSKDLFASIQKKHAITASINIASALLITSAFLSISSTRILTKLIQLGLILPIVLAGISAIKFFLHRMFTAGIMSILSGLLSFYYLYSARKRIPFASATLNCGIHALRENKGVFLSAFFVQIIMILWTALWIFSLLNVTGYHVICKEFDNQCSAEIEHPQYILPWILFLLWEGQVMLNVVNSISAGVTATWYFSSQDYVPSCCSKAVLGSLYRSLTTTFGSICFGSLLVALIQLIHMIVRNAREDSHGRRRRSGNGGQMLLLCCLDCILKWTEDIAKYFNKWAFIYVAIYGYSYCEGGKKVMALFQQRGWSLITNDWLINIATFIVSFNILAVSYIVASLTTWTNLDAIASSISLQVGIIFVTLLASTVHKMLNSSACTALVCYAEAPAQLEQRRYHTQEIHQAFLDAYPNVVLN